MARRSKKEKRATTIGAVLVLIGLLVAFGTVSAINLNYADALEEAGEGATSMEVLWSIEDEDDIDVPFLVQENCGPIIYNPFPVYFANATVGSGLALNTTTPAPIRVCAPPAEEYTKLVLQTTLTAGEVLSLGGKVFDLTWTTDAPTAPNRTLVMKWGLVQTPLIPDQVQPIVCAACPLRDPLVEGQHNLMGLDTDIVSFLATFPTWLVTFVMIGDAGSFPAEGVEWTIDYNLLGDPVTQSNVSVDLFGALSVSQVLGTMYYGVALMGVMGAVLIWPGSTTDTVTKRLKGGKRS